MLDNVGSAISKSCMVVNVGLSDAAGIASPFVSVQVLFPLPADIVSFRCRPMSENVSSVIFWSGMFDKVDVGLLVGIASPSLSVQKLFLLPVSWPTIKHILSSCCRPMSGNAGRRYNLIGMSVVPSSSFELWLAKIL